MNKHVSVRVTGKVQGVNFRNATKDYAREQGLHGFVRNEPDGSVYLEAEGDVERVDALLDWLDHGPSAADVDGVSKKEGQPRGFADFSVERTGAGYS